MSEREILDRIIPYVPPYWVRQAFADPDRTLVGREERMYAAVLFVDISGFTPISEALSQRGREGVEELSTILDRYFTVMSEPVIALGGEVVKFAGDSLIVLFSVQPDGGDAHLGAALHCSLRMQAAMSEFAEVHTSAGTFPLRMKIGMGEGAIYTTTVGDEEKGMQPVLAGRPIIRCMQAEDMANPGEIVADAALVSRMPGRLDIGEARGTFRLIAGAEDMPVLPPIRQADVTDLSSECAASLIGRLVPYLPVAVVERIRQGQRGLYGEHRRVTVMFVRFGGLNYDLEPSVGHILQIYFTTMRDCILSYGGRLNEVDITSGGGTLVVFFGAPTAHEDDELRAVSCAWEMQQAVADVRLSAGAAAERLRQSIGISSSSVFVGDVGTPVRRTYTAVGDEVNLASRLMNVAHWGEVVVTSWVQKRVAGHFEFEAMGEVDLKGKAEPVPLFALIGPRQESARDGLFSDFPERRPLVGRDVELATLDEVQNQAWQGKPQLLLITGEAGVGKSRLIDELMQAWIERGGRVYGGDCHRQGGDAPYSLWIALLRAAFGLQESDLPDRQREKIEIELTFLSPSLASRGELFQDLLGMRASEEMRLLASSVNRRRTYLHQTLIDFFRVVAQRQPLLVVLESLHDIDDASLTLLNDLLHSVRGLPLLVCAAYRPRKDMRLAETVVTTTRLVLDPLSGADSLTLAQMLLEEAGLSPDLAPEIADQAQGNPFYLQEMASALVGLDDPSTALSQRVVIPESISDMILAQLDPLGEDFKLTMRIAAVVGQLFSFRVLQAAHPLSISRHDLAARLATLERMRIVGLDHFGMDIHYRFRHAITQRVIYASLLTADRERFHRRVGQALERVYVDDLESRYELLADHFYCGNVLTKAISYSMLAGHRATQAGAVREALSHYTRTKGMLLSCDVCSPRCVQGVHLSLLLDRGNVHYQLVEIVEAVDDYEQAFLLAGSLADLKSQGEALLFLGNIALRQARYPKAQFLIRQAMQRFSALGDGDSIVRALLSLSQLCALQGHFENAVRHSRQAMSLTDGLRDHARVAQHKSWLGTVYFATGQTSQALDALRRAIELGRKSGDQIVVSESMSRLARVLLSRGRWGQAIQLSREAVEIYQTSGTRLDVAEGKRVMAMVLTRIGAYEEASDYLDDAMKAFAEAGWRVGLASGFWITGEALLALGRYEQATERFHQALRLGRETHTAEIIVNAQLGLSKLAIVRRNWPEGQRLCTEARARARQAHLSSIVVSARLGLSRSYLGRREWKRAQREATQALDESHRLRSPYDIFRAAATLGEALMELDQLERAHQRFQEADASIQQLAGTLPQPYAQLFLDRPYVRVVRDRAVLM